MSGVIDSNGQQWEHCNICAEFVRIQDLLYVPPNSGRFPPGGCDICENCMALDDGEREHVQYTTAKRESAKRAAEYKEMGWDVTLNPDFSITIHSTGAKA